MSESTEISEGKIKPIESVPTFDDVFDCVNKTREKAVILAEELGKKFSQEQLAPVVKDAIIRILGGGDFGWPKFALELFPFVELDDDIKDAAKKELLRKICIPDTGESTISRIMRWYEIPEGYLQTKQVRGRANRVIIGLINNGHENQARQIAFNNLGMTHEEFDKLKLEAKS